MDYPFQALKLLSLLAYAATLVIYLSFFLKGDTKTSKLATPFLLTTLSIHAVYLLAVALIRHHVPVTNLGEAMTTTVFCTTLIYYFIELKTREKNLGIFVIGLALAFQAFSVLFFHQFKPTNPLLATGGFAFHAVANILGYSGFFLGFVFSLLYLLLGRQIKSRATGQLFRRLPPLGTLDTMSLHSITFGFALFSIGLVAGSLWGKQVWGNYLVLEPKIVLALLSWAIYGTYLVMRRLPGWSRKKSAVTSTAAFALLAFSFMFSSMLSPSHPF